jgi:hypothetical protein
LNEPTLTDLARNRQVPDDARPNVTLGEIRAALAEARAVGVMLDIDSIARALRRTYPEHLRRSNDDQLRGDARYLVRAILGELAQIDNPHTSADAPIGFVDLGPEPTPADVERARERHRAELDDAALTKAVEAGLLVGPEDAAESAAAIAREYRAILAEARERFAINGAIGDAITRRPTKRSKRPK